MKLSELFYLQRSDRQVVIALLGVIGVGLTLMWWAGEQTDDATPVADTALTDTLAVPVRTARYYQTDEQRAERFVFDPNTADSTQLLRLGLQPWQVRNIYKYRARGGIYRKKEDFARLYGLTVKQYRELEPYIRISSDYAPASTLFTEQPHERDTTRRYPVKIKADEHVLLNHADTAALQSVPGIGPYFARQIVAYGERLGGYVSVSQLDEIHDFPVEAKAFFVIGSAPIRQLNINELSLEQLKRHPYINYYQARAIIDYRRLRGRISDLSDLSLSRDFPPEAIDRLRPYVTY